MSYMCEQHRDYIFSFYQYFQWSMKINLQTSNEYFLKLKSNFKRKIILPGLTED